LKTSKLILPAKHKSIAAARYLGRGRETEYRIDGNPGLVLVVQAPTQAGASTRTWRAYYSLTRQGKRTIRKIRLGSYPTLGLAAARRRAAEIAEAVEQGGDPVADELARKAAHAHDELTFSDLVQDHLADLAKRRSTKHVRDLKNALSDKALPKLGHMRPRDITATDVQGVVDAVYDRGSEAMARHLLTYLRAVFNNAIRNNQQIHAKYRIEINPADRVGRDGRYGTPPVDERHLDDAEIALFWRALDQSEIDERTRLILKLLLLTGQRPSEVRCCELSELKLDGKYPEWHLPGLVRERGKPLKRRTKNGLPHLVPLPPLAAKLFRRGVELAGDAAFVFPSDATKDGILGEYTLGQATNRLIKTGRLACKPFSPKDLRTTVKTGMARLGIPREIRDRVQNHKPQGIGDKAYNFHEYTDEKRDALDRWVTHVKKLIGCR
jgi:integrase